MHKLEPDFSCKKGKYGNLRSGIGHRGSISPTLASFEVGGYILV